LKEIEIMSDYLLKRSDGDSKSQIKDIIVWKDLTGTNSFSSADVEKVRKEHNDKLQRYRERKDWEAWVEEDELDLEGERILAEVKNYKQEYFYKISANF
jgi:hypothetical protein